MQKKIAPEHGVGPVRLSRHVSANIKTLRRAKGWSQSDLAKKLWGTTLDSRGYTVARNRDRISAWEMGRAAPTPDNLLLLSEALGVSPVELAPDVVSRSAAHAPAALSLQILEENPDQAHLRVNMVLPSDVASEIMGLITRVAGDVRDDNEDGVVDAG